MKFSSWDFVFTLGGLPLFLLDIGLDVWAAVDFYRQGDYWFLGVLLLCLVVSSVLAQIYSWLWYKYDEFEMKTKIERWPSTRLLKVLHVIQLGIYFRHAAVLEVSVLNFCHRHSDSFCENSAVFLNHDLSMLRLIETFSESAPQLVLIITIILLRGQLDVVTVLKAIGSASAIAFCVTMYHRSLRSFLTDKVMQPIGSSVVYFLWNLLLISPRIVALALFASVLPCFIFTHFICSWMVFFFFAWLSKTEFMDSPCGEWLYRATVGVIWYFIWFSVTEGKTRNRSLLYHGFILVDISVLCGVWCWQMSMNPLDFKIEQINTIITAACVAGVYIIGLIVKIIYYKFCHPNVTKDQLKGESTVTLRPSEDEVDSGAAQTLEEDAAMIGFRAAPQPAQPPPSNRRMRKLAENFYC
ncbi:XK-related protein 8-like [Pholidichthys leucotaenia]